MQHCFNMFQWPHILLSRIFAAGFKAFFHRQTVVISRVNMESHGELGTKRSCHAWKKYSETERCPAFCYRVVWEFFGRADWSDGIQRMPPDCIAIASGLEWPAALRRRAAFRSWISGGLLVGLVDLLGSFSWRFLAFRCLFCLPCSFP